MSRNDLPRSSLMSSSMTLATKCFLVTVGFEKPHTYEAVANWMGGLNQHALDGTGKINGWSNLATYELGCQAVGTKCTKQTCHAPNSILDHSSGCGCKCPSAWIVPASIGFLEGNCILPWPRSAHRSAMGKKGTVTGSPPSPQQEWHGLCVPSRNR